jgi:hypothetical protein
MTFIVSCYINDFEDSLAILRMWCDSNERLGSKRRDITFQNFDIIIPDEKMYLNVIL